MNGQIVTTGHFVSLFYKVISSKNSQPVGDIKCNRAGRVIERSALNVFAQAFVLSIIDLVLPPG